MSFNAYLHFNGNCEAAFKFYEQCFGGKIEAMIRHAGTPAEAQTPPEWLDKIMHARLSVGDSRLMASDVPPGMYQAPQGFSVNIDCKTPDEAERIYQGLSEGASVKMPLQTTFWALKFAMLVDRFGIPWMINCEAPR